MNAILAGRMLGASLRVRSRGVSGRSACGALCGALLSLSAGRAQATIVWEGREVAAWPDLPSSADAGNVVHALLPAHAFPHPSGVVHGLTILVDFSDQSSAYDKTEIEAWLNQAGYQKFGLTGSVRDYYLAQSAGQVDFQNELHGFYRAKKAKSYYQGGTAYERADELWSEVIAALDSEVDFSKFDNDHDGKTEAISLLYAGDEGTFGKGLWPHASGSNDVHDGVRLNRYMMTALNTRPTNYVFAHESGHMLFGWPDLYGVGDYCIMANRGSDTNPVGINDMFRADQGWVPVVEIDAAKNARLSSEPDGAVYRFLNSARSTEYFLWSNVQNTAEWSSLAGGGLLVWHFDQSISSNTPPAKLELAVVQASPGSRQLGATTWPDPGSAASDLYAKGRNAELSASSTPKSAWNDGSASGLRIYDISASGPSMQFSVGTGALPIGGQGGAGGTSSGAGAGGSGNSAGARSGAGGTSSGGAAGRSGSAGNGGRTSDGASNGGAGTGGTSSAGTSSGAGFAGSTSLAGAPSGGLSAGGHAGAAAAGSAAGDGTAPDSGGGCGCRVARQAGPSGVSLALFALASVLGLTRRRARKATDEAGKRRA